MASKRRDQAGNKPVHRYSLRSKSKVENDVSSPGPPSPKSLKVAVTAVKDEPVTPRPCFKRSNNSLADITLETLNTPREKSGVTPPKTPKSVRLKIPRRGIVLPEQATKQNTTSLSSNNCWDKSELEALGVTVAEYEFDLDEVHGDVNKLWPAAVENWFNVVSQCLSGSDEDMETSYQLGCPMTRTNTALEFQDALDDSLKYNNLLDDIAHAITPDGRLRPAWHWGSKPEASEARRWLKSYTQSGRQPLQRKLFTIRDPFAAETVHTFIKWIWDYAPKELKILNWVADSDRIQMFPWFKGFPGGHDWPKRVASLGLQSLLTRHEGGMRLFPGTLGHPADMLFFIIESKVKFVPEKPEDTGSAYAGQILIDMLVEVCQEDRIKGHEEGQESFVIQIVGSRVTIWYASFPSSYLDAIRELGHKYRSVFPKTHGVKLYQTRHFDIHTGEGRSELFKAIVKLLWYFASGKSRVGYLQNYKENPIHLAQFVQKAEDEDEPKVDNDEADDSDGGE